MSRYTLVMVLILAFGLCACAAEPHHDGGGWKSDFEAHHGRY